MYIIVVDVREWKKGRGRGRGSVCVCVHLRGRLNWIEKHLLTRGMPRIVGERVRVVQYFARVLCNHVEHYGSTVSV